MFSVCPALCSTLDNLHITFTTVSEVSVNIWKLRHHKVKSETPQLVSGGAVFVPRPDHRAKALTSPHTSPLFWDWVGQGTSLLHLYVHRIHLLIPPSEEDLCPPSQDRKSSLLRDFWRLHGVSRAKGPDVLCPLWDETSCCFLVPGGIPRGPNL